MQQTEEPEAISGISKQIVTLSSLSGSSTGTQTQDTLSVTWYGYVEDKAQNYAVCEISFKKDATDPVCSLTLSGNLGENSWYISDVEVSFSENTDATSGVSSYGLGSVTGSKTATQTQDTASQTYTGHIKDNAGNTSTCTTSLKKDATKPECALTLSGDLGENSWYTSDVVVSFSKNTDAMSGISSYGLGSVTGSKTATQTQDTASQSFTGYIKDNAGNENTCTTSLKKDATDPTCTNSGDNSTWTNSNVTITYGCSDNLSNCNSSYSGGSKLFNTTTSTSTIDSYTIKDNAGNSTTCASRTANVYVDKTAPKCTNSGDSTTWTNADRTIYYGCDDSESGCDSSNSGGSTTFSTSTTNSTIGSYTIKDNAGNSTTCASRTANVYVDKDSPTCSIWVSSGTQGDNGWYKSSSVTVSSSFSDTGGSGVSGKGTAATSSVTYNGNTTYTISSNTAGTTVRCFVKDTAGNTGRNSITIMKDDGGSSSCTATGASAWSNVVSSVTVSFVDPPVSGCQSHSMTGSSLSSTCSHAYQVSTDEGTVKETITASNTVTTKSGATVSCSVPNVKVLLDKEAPTISCSKSNTGTTGGVTVTCTCSDGSGSGIASCPTSTTGVTSTSTYTATDNAGNTASTTISVTATTQTQYRTRTWDECLTGSENACVGGNKTCKTAACGSYDCSCSYYCSYRCTSPSTSSGQICSTQSGNFKEYTSRSDASNSCSGVNSIIALNSSCSYTCSTEVKGGCSTCYYSCQHADCGYDSCLTTENTCEAGYTDYGSWSTWSTSSCTSSTTKDCNSRTIYS